MRKGLVSPSGGLIYHYRAKRYAGILWRPTRSTITRAVSHWLNQLPKRDVVLIGPSGGYLFDISVFENAPHVYAYDIDPLAPMFYARLHKKVPVWTRRDALSSDSKSLDLGSFKEIQVTHPGAAIVFCNLLGQLPLMYPTSVKNHTLFQEWQTSLEEALTTTPWFSFHDRLTLVTKASFPSLLESEIKLSDKTLLNHVPNLESNTEVFAHQTEGLFKNARFFGYCSWPILPTETHILEWCFNLPNS